MKTVKNISKILNPPAPHMVGDGFRVHNFFPNGAKLDMSPFYLLDYNAEIEFSARNIPRGVGVHPHRGFETVTIAYQGAVAHHDSAGNSGVIHAGDIQWMTAASGILHKEYHEAHFSQQGGPFQMVQLWVNLPAKHKMDRPKYQDIKNDQIGRFHLPNQNGSVEVIAGNYQGVQGSASTFSPLEMYNIKLNEGAEVTIDLPRTHNTGFLVVQGSVTVNEKETANTDQFVYFDHDGETITIKAASESIVLVLSGAPIDEPIAAYGPFLMNTYEEIEQAIADYNQGKFGYLEE